MAIYHLNAKVVSRGKGQSAIAAAAYRSGERLEDEQTGEQKFYEKRALRIIYTDILAPRHAPEWVHDRNRLWNEAERAEKRKDAQLAREIEVSLPHELTEQQREWLVKDFAREAFVRRGYVVDIAIHTPDRGGDRRNHHAHLMITMRALGPDGFAPMKDRSLNSTDQLEAWREQWANLANRHLERHGHDARVDHRSLEAQGIEREATSHVGYAGSEIAARGGQSDRMDELTGILARNGIRAELRASEEELAQLRELTANENLKLRPAPGQARGTRAMLEGPSDEELKKQPKREKQYLDHLQQRHERARAMLDDQQRARELDDRAKAFQQAKELEAEEARKKKTAQEAEAGEGRNGDISSAAARYSIAIGEHYDVRDPYASLARAAGAESAMFHRNQEKLKAEAAQETDPEKRQAIELRRKIEGCDYMAITSERLAGISVAVTGRDDNATAVTDRQQAAHWRAMAQGLREERSVMLEAIETRETGAKGQLEARVQKSLESHQARRSDAQEPTPTKPEPPARPAPRVVVEATMPEPAARPAEPASLTKDAAAAQPQKEHGNGRADSQQASPEPNRSNYRTERSPEASQPPPSARIVQSPEPKPDIQMPAAASSERQQSEPANDSRPLPTQPHRPDYQKLKEPAALRVVEQDGRDAGSLSAFVQREQGPPEPYRPASLHDRLSDNRLWKEHRRAQMQEIERTKNAEQALGRLGADLEKGRPAQAADLRSLTREQWDSVRTRGEAGLVNQVREAKDRSAQDRGREMEIGPPRRDL